MGLHHPSVIADASMGLKINLALYRSEKQGVGRITKVKHNVNHNTSY